MTTLGPIEAALQRLTPGQIRRAVYRNRKPTSNDGPFVHCLQLQKEAATAAYWRHAMAVTLNENRGREITKILCTAETAAEQAAARERERQLAAMEAV